MIDKEEIYSKTEDCIISDEPLKINATFLEELIHDVIFLEKRHKIQQSIFKKVVNFGGRSLFIVVVSAATVPLFLQTSIDYAKNKELFFVILIPTAVVTLNVLQAALGSHETIEGFGRVIRQKKPLYIKLVKSGFTFIVSLLPSAPAIVTSVLESNRSDNEVWKWVLRLATPLSELPINFFSTFELFDHSLIPILYKFKCKNDLNEVSWENTLSVKKALIKKFKSSCVQLKNFPVSSRKIDSYEESAIELIKKLMLFNNGFDFNGRRKISSSLMLFGFFKKTVQLGVAGLSMSGLSGFMCSSNHFWQNLNTNGFSWAITFSTMIALFYLSGIFGYNAMELLFDTAAAWYYGEQVDLPFSLRNYPKTTIILATLIVFLAGFSWGTSVKLVTDYCPDVIKEPMLYLVYIGLPTFNVLICFKVIDDIIKKYSQVLGTNDEKNAHELIQLITKIVEAVEKMPLDRFAKSINSSNIRNVLMPILEVPESLLSLCDEELSNYKTNEEKILVDENTLLIPKRSFIQ